MASTSRALPRATDDDDRSAGGKILRGRRNPRPSPYDRPAPTPSKNWLTGVVLPKIATGAASLLSSFISSPEDSSSSSSSSGADSPADDSDDESTYSHYLVDGVDTLNQEKGYTPEFDNCLKKESQLTIRKSETKRLIEKLIIQESFSREERDNLMGIINSRVIDVSIRDEGLVKSSGVPDFCTKAIKEAKQWIEEKKEASSSKLQLSHQIPTLSSVMLSQDTRGGLGSPVDMAKAYMRDRPPWSSPLLNSIGEKTPSRIGLEVLKDEAPYISSFSSSKRKLSSGSWSIQDEIRRVRSKATEDMLKTFPSPKNSFSSFSLEPDGIGNTLLNGRIEMRREDGLQDSNLFPSVKLIDASSNLTAAGVSTSGCLPASAVDLTQDNIQIEELQLQPVTRAQIQGVENVQMVEKDKCAADGSHSATPEPISEDDLRFIDKSCPMTDGDIQFGGKAIDSGFTISGAREVENNHQPSDDKNPNAVCSSHDKSGGRDRREEKCELLSESLVEIPGMDEVAVDNSLTNSIKHTEESSKQFTRPKNLKKGVKGKTTKVGIGQGRNLRPKGRAT